MSRILILIVRIYQYTISPVIGPRCRYTPTCSQYAIEAIHKYGGIKGSRLALRRLLCCHPRSPGGYDPVP